VFLEPRLRFRSARPVSLFVLRLLQPFDVGFVGLMPIHDYSILYELRK
jgi:hypothetical protein